MSGIMETYEIKREKLFTAVYTRNLEEVKRISYSLSETIPRWHPNYNLLWTSLIHKHLDIAKFFLRKNCEVVGHDYKNYRGFTALHLAVLNGDFTMVRTILKKVTTYNTINNDGLLPLHLVVYRHPDISRSPLSSEQFDEETSQIIDIFLQYGVNINANVYSLIKNGYTLLHLAAECGNEKIIPVLVEKRANFNAKSETGLTPLHVAVINRNLRIVNLLLNFGVKMWTRDKRGKSPLCWAIELGHLEIVNVFFKYSHLAPQNKSMYNPTIKDDTYAFLTAVKVDNISIVESLLKEGTAVNTHWKNGKTPLHIAAENGSENILQILLDHGANMSATSQDGKTPLRVAVEKEWIEIVKILLDYVPDINSATALPDFDPLLNVAIEKNNEELIKLLLQKRHHFDNKQCTESPLHIAVRNNQINILKILVENGIDLNATDMFGRIPLQVAAADGSPELVQEFCDIYSKKERKWADGYAALYSAALNGRENIVKLLLENGADLNARTEHFSAPLAAAAEKGHINIVKLFLKNGADVNEIGNNKKTALDCAVEKQFYNVVKCLINNGANVNLNASGDSPLHFAAKEKDLNIVKLLMKEGADINAKNVINATPLFLAIQNNRNRIVRYLVKNGADVNIADLDSTIKSFNFSSDCIHNLSSSRGLRPLIVAVDNCNLEVVQILLEHGSPTDIRNEEISPLHLASENGMVEIVKRLIEFGANINSICKQKYTPLSHAVASGHTETFKYLLSRGVSFKENSINSLLHIALSSIHKDENIVKHLLDLGAGVEATDVYYKTPLHCAISSANGEDKKDLFKLLLDYGSEIDARDREGNTPLHIAAQTGDFVAAEVFLSYGANVNAINNSEITALQYLVNLVEDDLILFSFHTDPHTCPFAMVAKSIVSLIAFRESAGIRVSVKNKDVVKRDKFELFYEKCKQELSFMKRMKVSIHNTKKMSYYETLTKSDNKLAVFMANTELVQSLESINLKETFPCYGQMLTNRLTMAKERRVFLRLCERPLQLLLKYQFTEVIVREIFSFLTLVDMKNLMRVFPLPRQSLFEFSHQSRQALAQKRGFWDSNP